MPVLMATYSASHFAGVPSAAQMAAAAGGHSSQSVIQSIIQSAAARDRSFSFSYLSHRITIIANLSSQTSKYEYS